MSQLTELIEKIENPELQQRIAEEVKKLNKQKKFGLVFEDHVPECTPLYDIPVKAGSTVAPKDSKKISDIYKVIKIKGENAICLKEGAQDAVLFPVDSLVSVAKFGDPIYPYLKPIDSICNAPDSDLWHTLIEADNYHALQLLEYLYAGKVDCIYIDPPYNTGARDWKYNNDYVDSSDSYRHSKWLSFMEKRLKLAKKLMNSADSVLIVTIDEKEYLYLGCLLEELFPEARIQMVSSMINPANVARAGEFGRSGEYIFFVMLGNSFPQRVRLDREWVSSKGRTHTGNVRWDLLKRSGTNAERRHSPGGFYPIYINPNNNRIEKIGEPLPAGISVAPEEVGLVSLLPIRQNGTEGNWQWSVSTFKERKDQGRVKIGGDFQKGYTVYILKDGEYSKIVNGEFPVLGHGINNEIITDAIDTEIVMATPGDIWKVSSHDATQYGSRLIGNIFADRRFTFPKSLYAVKDCIYFFTANKPNALIVDFFAGSGTTLHAVNILNAEDGGHRRCIIVTNNEVSEAEAKSMTAKGLKPGDDEWESLGIARYVTWPRTVCSIKGQDIKGNPLKGDYISTAANPIHMSDGFKANAIYYKLGFLDKTKVSLGMQFKELLPILWMKTGAIDECPSISDGGPIPDMLLLPKNKMAILNDENQFAKFAEELAKYDCIKNVFLVTDYENSFISMTRALPGKTTYQLYRDYLDNFRINARRDAR